MVEFIDENGRVFGVINIVDLLAILLILAVFVAGVSFVLANDSQLDSQGEENTVAVTVTIRIDEVQPYVASAVPNGGFVSEDGTVRVLNKSTRSAEVIVKDESGQLHVREHPQLQTVVVQVELAATRSEGVLQYDETPLKIGRTITLDFENVEIKGSITGLTPPGS